MIRQLREEFDGKGEVKGYRFRQAEKGDNYYIYEVTDTENPGRVHYEVFRRVTNELYQVESYPTSKAFGNWAWTAQSLEHARDIVRRKLAPKDAGCEICPTC